MNTDTLTVSREKLNTALGSKVGVLLGSMKQLPLIECKEEHFFGPSIYVKQVTMPTGAVVIGKVHKHEHLCVMLTGKMILVNEDGDKKELVAPLTFVAKPGRKVAYILDTVIFQNIFATEEKDIDKLEDMFIDNSKSLKLES